jgi:Lar family restriction alleviation protein
MNEQTPPDESKAAVGQSALNVGLGELFPCPFCGGEPRLIYKGNDHTKSRSVTIKCSCCRIERTDSAMRHDFNWLENVAIEHWNTRTPNV